MAWRWDQGRVEYFEFDEIHRVSQALVSFDGKALPKGGSVDTLRAKLKLFSSQPFAPNSKSYPVWRNYGRVFQCQMLATKSNGLLVCTDLCRGVATGSILCDDYLLHVAQRFYYDSPVFDGYSASGTQVFPICAAVKLLISNFVTGANPCISIDDIASRIKGNALTGLEPLSTYGSAKKTSSKFSKAGDELRQVREMIIFFSQFTFLKWKSPNLFLDVGSVDEAKKLAKLFSPAVSVRDSNPALEVLALGKLTAPSGSSLIVLPAPPISPLDQEFVEGSKVRVTHLRVERSAKLREFYFSASDSPHVCDMCQMDTGHHYPWANRLVELHHLLPLASPIHVGPNSSSLKDIVGLCPSCHRATHKYYSGWLKKNSAKDFSDRNQAKVVYDEAKNNFVS